MKLEKIDEQVFGLFNNWLYTQDIEHSGATDPELMELAKLWTAAGNWKIPRLQNQAMGDLKALIIDPDHEIPDKDKDTVLRQFIVHAYTARGDTALKRLAVHK
jgi:hypothetical protein